MENASMFAGTIWSILPPILAIGLALITKEVYFSLLLGIFAGALLWTNGSVIQSLLTIVDVMGEKVGGNFALVTKSGASAAYGKWASKAIKTKRGASLATIALGCLIFVDDYFNCLTVGTVMSPVTDRYNINRTKLAYIIDATAAPVCIIAPISSWAIAVASELGGGLSSFMEVIPHNLYALLTLSFVCVMCFTRIDYGPMSQTKLTIKDEKESGLKQLNGSVLDLILPMSVLISSSIIFMAYVGGFFEGISFSEAIGANPTVGLALGAFVTLVFTMILYIFRRLLTFKDCIDGVLEGAKSMFGAILILIFAWSLSGICRELIGTGEYVSSVFASMSFPYELLPVLVFIVGALLSFSMGTAWGTFAILIPIINMICVNQHEILVIALGATLAGSVFGDHCSPISDTTILSSAGAQCDHINHVKTQLPYATHVAIVCAIGYLLSGFIKNAWIVLLICEMILLGSLYFVYRTQKDKCA